MAICQYSAMARSMPKWNNPTGRGLAFRSPQQGMVQAVAPMRTGPCLEVADKQVAARAPAVVDISGASLTFETGDGKVEALSNVNLQIAAGDFVSFIGPSGCGKTTLLRVIADLEQPT